MWHHKSVEVFLKNQRAPQEIVEGITTRMTAAINESGKYDGILPDRLLDEILGEPAIAEAFREARETDQRLHEAAFS